MQVAEWQLLKRLPTLSLPQLNTHLSSLITHKHGSMSLYQKLVERCMELSPSAPLFDLENTVNLLIKVEIGDVVRQFYTLILPKMTDLMRDLPGDRVANLVVAYSSMGIEGKALYHRANEVLKPVARGLNPEIAVKIANWLAPYSVKIPEKTSLYPELEEIRMEKTEQAVLMLQGFVKAGKGSYAYLNEVCKRILTEQASLSQQYQSTAIHYITRCGLQDSEVYSCLEDLALALSMDLMVSAAFDLASAGYRPLKLLSVIRSRCEEVEDGKDLMCLQWVYRRCGEEFPKEFSALQSFLFLRDLNVKDFLLSRRLHGQHHSNPH